MSDPWFKFYPQDWLGDEKLRMCSVAARGLWADMISIMHRGDPYGHLAVNGDPVDDAQLARLVGEDLSTVRRLKAELERFDVYSSNRKGVIYSRRMVKDHELKKKRAKSGAEGGKRTQSKSLKSNPNPDLLKQNSSKCFSPEARSQKKEYWWTGQVIRLVRRDYDAWKGSYPGSPDQFDQWLASRDDWYQSQPPDRQRSWFLATKSALERLSKGKAA